MRIAFLCTSSLNDPSPRGRWFPVARELARAGHNPTLLMLHPTWDRLSQRQQHSDGVDLRYVGQMHVYGMPGQRRYYGPLQLMAVSLQAAISLARAAVALRPDIIQLAKPQPINGLAGILASRMSRVRLLLDCDDYEAAANRFSAGWQRQLVQQWEDRLPFQAAGITVNTRFLERRCRTLGIDPARIGYVPNGLSDEQFIRPNQSEVQAIRNQLGLTGHPTLVYTGAVSTIAHGLALLLDAFALAQRQLPEARLVIVGDGDDRPALMRRSATLGLARSIQWVGAVPPEQVRHYLALAHASVDPVADTPAMAARSPLKIVESLAQGIPVLTSAIGDRAETITESAGLLVAPGDASALAHGIVALLGEPVFQHQRAAGTLERANALRWANIVGPWLAMVAG